MKKNIYPLLGILLSCLAGLLLLTACKKETAPPMRIGMNVWPGYEPLFLAQQSGNLGEKDFRLVELPNSSDVARAFRNGTLDGACLTLDEAFYTLQDGMDPVILLVMDQSHGADALLVRPEIKTLADLRGKRIAVEVSAVGAYTLTRALQNASLSVRDVTLVFTPIDGHLAAYNSGAVDAVVTFEPVKTQLIEAGAVDLFNSSMIPGEIVDVLIVHRNYLERHPERAVALKKAWFAALEKIRQSPEESAKFMAVREKITPEKFLAALQGLRLPDEQESHVLLDGPEPKLLKSAERLKSIMLESRLLRRDISLSSLFASPDPVKPRP